MTSVTVRFDIVYWSGVLIILVGLSRIIVGANFASDVVAGLLVGSFWLLAGIAIAELERPLTPSL